MEQPRRGSSPRIVAAQRTFVDSSWMVILLLVLLAANPQTGKGGDLIVDIDGQPIGDLGDLNSYLVFHTEVGQTIQITVLRDGERTVLPLVLGERPG